MIRIAQVPQESLAFSVEGWLYPPGTHAGALTSNGAVFGQRAEKVIEEKSGYRVGLQLGLPQEESSTSSPEH